MTQSRMGVSLVKNMDFNRRNLPSVLRAVGLAARRDFNFVAMQIGAMGARERALPPSTRPASAFPFPYSSFTFYLIVKTRPPNHLTTTIICINTINHSCHSNLPYSRCFYFLCASRYAELQIAGSQNVRFRYFFLSAHQDTYR